MYEFSEHFRVAHDNGWMGEMMRSETTKRPEERGLIEVRLSRDDAVSDMITGQLRILLTTTSHHDVQALLSSS